MKKIFVFFVLLSFNALPAATFAQQVSSQPATTMTFTPAVQQQTSQPSQVDQSNQANLTSTIAADDNIILRQKKTIKTLTSKVAQLNNQGLMQTQLVKQLQVRIASLSDEIRQLSMQNLLLQSSSGKQAQTLTSLEKLMQLKKQAVSMAQQTLPNFTGTLMRKSLRLLHCAKGNCRYDWGDTAESISSGNVNQSVSNELEQFEHLPAIVSIVLIIIVLALVLLIFFSYSLSIKRGNNPKSQPSKPTLASESLSSVSGEDIYASKLDLARAYIDMEDNQSAKLVLHDVAANGSPTQRKEATRLLNEMGA